MCARYDLFGLSLVEASPLRQGKYPAICSGWSPTRPVFGTSVLGSRLPRYGTSGTVLGAKYALAVTGISDRLALVSTPIDKDDPYERVHVPVGKRQAGGVTMEVLFASVPVADLHGAMGWYEQLFGRPADIVCTSRPCAKPSKPKSPE
jgi:hypothetical protein